MYGTYVQSAFGEIYYQNLTRNATVNAATGVISAMGVYAPSSTPVLMEG